MAAIIPEVIEAAVSAGAELAGQIGGEATTSALTDAAQNIFSAEGGGAVGTLIKGVIGATVGKLTNSAVGNIKSNVHAVTAGITSHPRNFLYNDLAPNPNPFAKKHTPLTSKQIPPPRTKSVKYLDSIKPTPTAHTNTMTNITRSHSSKRTYSDMVIADDTDDGILGPNYQDTAGSNTDINSAITNKQSNTQSKRPKLRNAPSPADVTHTFAKPAPDEPMPTLLDKNIILPTIDAINDLRFHRPEVLTRLRNAQGQMISAFQLPLGQTLQYADLVQYPNPTASYGFTAFDTIRGPYAMPFNPTNLL